MTQEDKLPHLAEAGGTVVVGVAVAEGLVLVGDSRMTVQSAQWQPSYKIISDSHNKVMEGETDVIQRIVLGVDFSRMATLKHFASMDEPTLKEVRTQLGQLEYYILYQALSLQDAVDLANFLVQATVAMQRFSFGTMGSIGSVPGVGGSVDVLVVTPFELTWISRKQVVAH